MTIDTYNEIRENLYAEIKLEVNDDINYNLERDIKPKTLDHKQYDVFDAVFRKSNDYWKIMSEKMSDSEYEAWVLNYVSSDQSLWNSTQEDLRDSYSVQESYESVTYRCIQCDKVYHKEERLNEHNRRRHSRHMTKKTWKSAANVELKVQSGELPDTFSGCIQKN